MNCNKCGTPIISGENTCRFCGSVNDYSARINKPEIIGFDDINYIEQENNEVEIIDFSLGLDEVILTDDDKEIIDLDLIIDAPVEEVILEPSINLDTTLQMEKIVEKEEDKKEIITKNSEDSDNKNGSNKKGLGFIIFVILFIISVVANFFLGINLSSVNKNVSEISNNDSKSEIVLNGYKLNIPSNWISDFSDNKLLIYDVKNKWASVTYIDENLDYSLVKDNVSNLTDSLGENNYLITSDYTKTINGKEFTIFKGKYYSYVVYVIVNEIDDNVSVTDLKFTGEVDEKVLDNILDSLSKASLANKDFIKDNFVFKDISKGFSKNISKEESE